MRYQYTHPQIYTYTLINNCVLISILIVDDFKHLGLCSLANLY